MPVTRSNKRSQGVQQTVYARRSSASPNQPDCLPWNGYFTIKLIEVVVSKLQTWKSELVGEQFRQSRVKSGLHTVQCTVLKTAYDSFIIVAGYLDHYPRFPSLLASDPETHSQPEPG